MAESAGMADDPQDLAAAFGQAVTVESTCLAHLVAKTGKMSVYNLFRQIVPNASMKDDLSRRLKGKISAPAFNKLMTSRCRFECGRTRKKSVVSSAGNRLFVHRRWLNPQDQIDRLALEANYYSLRDSFPHSKIRSRSKFMRVLSDLCSQWNALCPVVDVTDHDAPKGSLPLQGPMSNCEGRAMAVCSQSSPHQDFCLAPKWSVSELLTWTPSAYQVDFKLLNGGQEVDLTLHRQWECWGTSVWMNPEELERFAAEDSI